MHTATAVDVELQDREVFKPTRMQKFWEMMENFSPMIGLFAGLFVLGLIATMVVLSLIPIYFQPKTVTVYQPNPIPYVLNYATDATNLGSLSVASTTDLANTLMKKLSLSNMNVNAAQFSSSIGKKRRAVQDNTTQCASSSGSLNGDTLAISITIDYPQGYNTPSSERIFLAKVDKHLKILYPNLILSMILTNGQQINVTASICSAVQNSTISCSVNPTSSDTCSSSTIRVCTSQSNTQSCSTPTCSTPCANGGTCYRSNMCACTSQWTGGSCTTAICSPACSNGGTCSSPGVCTCATGWTGSTCTTAICAQLCQNSGTCTAPNACTCPPGYVSPYCSKQPTCYYGKDKVDLVEGGQRSIEDLQVGDRVWSIGHDGSSYIEDEIIMMMHWGPNTTTTFYTLTTIDGHHISLTNSHRIPVFDPEENEIKIIKVQRVVLEHLLIMFNRKVEIKDISIETRMGFYAPLTHTGYLLVNNISTSIYTTQYDISTKAMHLVLKPFRMYFCLMRWIFGNEYNPLETNVKEGFHPIIDFLLKIKVTFILSYITPGNILLVLFILCTLRFLSKSACK